MTFLKLWFIQQDALTLEKIEFSHSLLQGTQCSVRGKTAGAYQGFSSFQWTPAVQSMSILFLLALAMRKNAAVVESARLEGFANSPAASLDFSLGKLPNWLLDVFGMDGHGNPIARRIFRRTNPERKRQGPVAVSINNHFLPLTCISVFLNEELVSDGAVLLLYAQAIEKQFFSPKRNNGPAINQNNNQTSPNMVVKYQPVERLGRRETVQPYLKCPCCGNAVGVALLANKTM